MKGTLLFVSLVIMLSTSEIFAQMTVAPVTKTSTNNESVAYETTALKPVDGQPYTFPSKEVLENSVPEKINGLHDQILSGKNTEAQIKELREQIWRFENAVVIK